MARTAAAGSPADLKSAPTPVTGPVSAIDQLRDLVSGDLESVNDLIRDRMQSPVSLIPELAGHLINSGGKRIRPMLTLAAARLCGYDGAAHHKLATAVEFIHTATLLHDDVVDGSDLRRGRRTANVIWGNQPSILVGDFLFSRAFQLMVEAGSLRVLDILSNAAAVIAEGEVLQLQTARRISTTEAEHMAVVAAKTAALFAAATEVGAVIAGRPQAESQALYTYGHALGVAFQLVDDALDYTARQAVLGKALGDDFREGKVTLPVVLAVARADEPARAFWRRTIEKLDQGPGDFDAAVALMEETGALADTMVRARAETDRARAALSLMPASPLRDVMDRVLDFVVDRAF